MAHTGHESAKQVLHDLLAKNRETYHIIFEGYLSNHLSHALVALYGLGATPEELQHYYDSYVQRVKLEARIPSKEPISLQNWQKHRGDMSYFEDYVAFFDKELASLGYARTFEKYLPFLVEGIGCSALHPLIQIGYALHVRDQGEVARGLAYLMGSYTSLGKAAEKPAAEESQQPVSPNLLIALLRHLHDDNTFDDAFPDHGIRFLKKMKVLVTDKYAEALKKYDIFIDRLDAGTLDQILRTLVLLVTHLFSETGSKDFFLLHGVTSSWALRDILLELQRHRDATSISTNATTATGPTSTTTSTQPQDPIEKLQIDLLRYYWKTLLAVYITQGRPAFDFRAAEADLTNAQTEDQYNGADWQEIIEKKARKASDSHLVKTIYVCHEAARVYGLSRRLFLKTAEEAYKVTTNNKRVFDGVGWEQY